LGNQKGGQPSPISIPNLLSKEDPLLAIAAEKWEPNHKMGLVSIG